MQTIFISCFTGLISRNILSTDVLTIILKNPDTRVVIITPKKREAVLRREFSRDRVIVEAVETRPLKGWTKFFWVLATNLLPTATRRVRRIAKLERDKNYLDYFFSGLAGLLGRVSLIRRAFRALVNLLAHSREFEYLFDRYNPTLLFVTDVYTPYDVKLMRLAERRGVETIGMVRSWDNVTSKTLLAHIPKVMVVNSARIRDELRRYGDVDPESVFISGIPHYDRYNANGRTPRAEFFKKFGLDPSKKLILFTPPSDTYLRHDPITPVVLKALGKIQAQVLVRAPIVGKIELGDYRPSANAVFDRPAVSPDFVEAHLDPAADRHLADSIFHSDLVITWASTMIIDSIVFGKPVVLVGFDASPRPYGMSITQYYDYDHQRHIINLGGARLAKSTNELLAWVRRYLAEPDLDSANRGKVASEYCFKLDGQSSRRLGNFLLKLLR